MSGQAAVAAAAPPPNAGAGLWKPWRTPLAIVAAAAALAFVPTLGLPAFYDSLL
jgi:branched-chain amino acid transport system permease protein